jgi:uncharacterized protein YutE (UPF0331/DUF86 family)
MMINHTVVRNLLGEIEKNANLLAELKTVPKLEFVNDPHRYLLAERCFQLAIQCVLDIGYYIASKSGWEKPADGPSAIRLMGEKGVLPEEFAQRIVGMANFRNILVHAYLNIKREIVYGMLERLDDFRTFQRHVLTYLATQKAR